MAADQHSTTMEACLLCLVTWAPRLTGSCQEEDGCLHSWPLLTSRVTSLASLPPAWQKSPPRSAAAFIFSRSSMLLSCLSTQTVAQMSFFCNCLVLTAREGCGQTGEVHVRRHCLCCSLLCPRGMRVKVICDEAWGLAILRGSREGSVISGAAPLGGFRPLALWFSLPLRGKSITYYITSHFFPHLHPEEEELKMCWGWLCFKKFSCFFWIVVWK